jgi:ABC-type spermidine/putrescine transport system permease subunit I
MLELKEKTAGGAGGSAPPAARDAWSPIVGPWSGLALMVPLILMLLALVGYPLVKLTVDSLTTGDGLGNYGTALGDPTVRKVLVTTVGASLLVTALSLTIGAMIAWYLRVVENRFAKAVLWLAVLLPVLMGTVVKNYAFVILFAREGPLNELLAVFGLGPAEILYTSTAVIIGMTYTMVPYAVLAMYSVFANFDLALVTAARSMGASRPRVMRTVVLPVAAPGLIATAAIVFAIALGFYVTPVLLGGAQAPFMALFVQANILQSFNYALASTSAVLLLLVAILVIAIVIATVGTRRLLQAFA